MFLRDNQKLCKRCNAAEQWLVNSKIKSDGTEQVELNSLKLLSGNCQIGS